MSCFKSNIQSPCYKCEDRTVKCHIDCIAFKEWKSDMECKKEEEKKMNYVDDYYKQKFGDLGRRLRKGTSAYKRYYKI